MPRRIISELELAAAKGENLPAQLSLLLDQAADRVGYLHHENPEDETVRNVIYYLKITSGRTSRLSRTAATHLLLDAAAALRILLKRKVK